MEGRIQNWRLVPNFISVYLKKNNKNKAQNNLFALVPFAMDLVQIMGICPYRVIALSRSMRETFWVSTILILEPSNPVFLCKLFSYWS